MKHASASNARVDVFYLNGQRLDGGAQGEAKTLAEQEGLGGMRYLWKWLYHFPRVPCGLMSCTHGKLEVIPSSLMHVWARTPAILVLKHRKYRRNLRDEVL